MKALTIEQLQRATPSVFATQAWTGTSDRYTFIPTIEVVEALIEEGFTPVSAQQSRTRIEGKGDFTKHMLRFQRTQDVEAMRDLQRVNPGHHFYEKHGQIAPEYPSIVLTNSHDRSSGYRLDAGLYRVVCSNGLTVQSSDMGSISVRHSGNIKDMVIDGCIKIIQDMPKVLESVDAMKRIELLPEERMIFANAALQLRYPDDAETGLPTAPIKADQLLLPRRTADRKDDLWTTFNTTQENFIKGGLRGRGTTGARTSTRAIKSVTEDSRMNKALWMLAEQMRLLKA